MNGPGPGFRVVIAAVVLLGALGSACSDDRPEHPDYSSWARVSGTRLPEGFELLDAVTTPYGFVAAGTVTEKDPSVEFGIRAAPRAFVSPDGRTWHATDLGSTLPDDDVQQIEAVAVPGQGDFLVATGERTTQVWTSQDGRRWTAAAGPGRGTPPPAGILQGAVGTDRGVVALIQPTDRFGPIAEADVEIWGSPDGWTWGPVAPPLPRGRTERFELAAFALDDQVMAAGYRQDPPPGGTSAGRYSAAAWTSRDGRGTWTPIGAQLPGALWPTAALTYKGGPLVCGAMAPTPHRTRAMGRMETLYDVHGPPACWTRGGDAWHRSGRFAAARIPDPAAVPLTEQRLESVVDADGTLIGVGTATQPDGERTVGAVWTSPDGRTWSESAAADNGLAPRTASPMVTYELRRVLRHGDTVIALGKENIFRHTKPYQQEFTGVWAPHR